MSVVIFGMIYGTVMAALGGSRWNVLVVILSATALEIMWNRRGDGK